MPSNKTSRSGSPYPSAHNTPGIQHGPLPLRTFSAPPSNVIGSRGATWHQAPRGAGGSGPGGPRLGGDGDGDDGENQEDGGRGAVVRMPKKGKDEGKHRGRKGKDCVDDVSLKKRKREDDNDEDGASDSSARSTPFSFRCATPERPPRPTPMSCAPSSDPMDDNFTPPPEDVVCMRANTPSPMQTPPPRPRVPRGPEMQWREQQAHRPRPSSASLGAVGWDPVGETQVPGMRRRDRAPVQRVIPTGRLEVSAAPASGREGGVGDEKHGRKRKRGDREDDEEEETKGATESCDDLSTTGSSHYDSDDSDEGGSGAAAPSTTSAPDSHDSKDQERKRPLPSSPPSTHLARTSRPAHPDPTASTQSHPTFSCASHALLNSQPAAKKYRTSPPRTPGGGREEFTTPYFNTLVSIPRLATAGVGMPLPPVSHRIFGGTGGGDAGGANREEGKEEEEGKERDEVGQRGEHKRRVTLIASPTLPDPAFNA